MSHVPPVDPLDDLAWTRVERGVFARLDAGEPARASIAAPRRMAFLLAATSIAVVAVVFAAIVIGRGLATAPVAPIVAAPADRSSPSDQTVPGVGAADDTAPLRFEAGPAPSDVTVGPMFATLDAHTTLLVTRDPQAPVAILDAGAAWFNVESRAGRAPFIVVAGEVTVRVTGTRFRVARFEASIEVTVEHGTVLVAHRGDTHAVAAGKQWSSREAPAPAPVDAGVPRAVPRPVKPVLDERARFSELAALEVSDPDAALGGYLVLARGSSSWAQLALFAAGRLATDRGDARAASLLSSYLRRFPQGPNADDARELLRHQKGRP